MNTISIDLGGTRVKLGVVSEGRVVESARLASNSQNGFQPLMPELERICKAWQEQYEISRMGIAFPSLVDVDKKQVLGHNNKFADCVGFDLEGWVKASFSLPMVLENDANAAALGEFVAGAGMGHRSLVAVTLGTGVGSGAVLEGKLYTGFNYAGMESGHTVIHRGGRECTCGRKGCWEAYASATGLIRSTREAMERNVDSALWRLVPTLEEVNGKTPFDAAQAGDAVAQAVLDEYVEDLACGLANLINLFQPEVLCIGGGVSAQGEALLAPVRTILDREEFTRFSPRRTQVRTARLGNDAGIIGAALLGEYR